MSEDQWAEFVRQAESDPAGAPKEPSARARMVTARLRALDEEAARAQGGGRRRGRRNGPAEPWQPDGWRTGPDRQPTARAAKRRRLVSALGLIALAGVLLVAMRPSLLTGHLPGAGEPASGPLPAESVPPTAAPPDADAADAPTLSEPFRGSPALRWADGPAAIELPEAEPVGGMSRTRVAQALSTTRELLVATNLDPATLRGEKPSKALALIDPLQKEERTFLDQALAGPTEDQDPLTLFTRFDPDEVRPVGNVVKARGRMTFEAGEPGSVEVHADYTFVYPLRKAAADSGEVTRTVVRRQLTAVLYDPAKVRATPGKISLLRHVQRAGNTACDVYDGFLHPQFRSDMPETEPSGPAVDPYDRSEWRTDEACGTVTRT